MPLGIDNKPPISKDAKNQVMRDHMHAAEELIRGVQSQEDRSAARRTVAHMQLDYSVGMLRALGQTLRMTPDLRIFASKMAELIAVMEAASADLKEHTHVKEG